MMDDIVTAVMELMGRWIGGCDKTLTTGRDVCSLASAVYVAKSRASLPY